MHEQHLTFTLHHLVAELDGLADVVLRKELGITHSQFAFLLALQEAQPIDVTSLAKRLGVSKAAVSKRVAWFVHRRYVVIAHDEANARRVLLRLTRSGDGLATRAGNALEARFAEVSAAFAGIDLAALHGQLAELLVRVRSLRDAQRQEGRGEGR